MTESAGVAEEVELSFDVWSLLAARLTQLDRESMLKVLDGAKLDEPTWDAANLCWLGRIAKDIQSGDMARADALAAACVEELRRRRDAGAELAPPAAPQAPDAPAPEPRPEPVAAAEVSVPSYLLAREVPMPAQVAAPALVVPVAQPRTADAGSATAELASIPEEPALPFGAAPSGAFERALAAGDAKPTRPHDPGGETTAMRSVRLDDEPSMPFAKAVKEPSATAPSRPSGSERPTDLGGETAALPSIRLEGGEVPFAKPGPTLTLEQYASLCAELAVFPERRAVLIGRYKLGDEAGKKREDAAWTVLFGSDAERQSRFNAAYKSFRGHLERQRG